MRWWVERSRGVVVAWMVCVVTAWVIQMNPARAASPPSAAAPTATPAPETQSSPPAKTQAEDDGDSPPPPPRRVPLKPNSEELRREIEARRLRLQQQPPEPGYEPRVEAIFEFGLGGGGEDLVTATNTNGDSETLAAGDGVYLTLGARVTPIWLAHVVGFGVGAAMGGKYWSIGGRGGEASMSKFMFIGLGNVLLSVDPKWLLVFQGGLEKDFGIGLSLNGSDSGVPFQSRVGYIIDAGAQYAFAAPWSFGFSFRATILDYTVQGTPLGANNYGFTLAFHYGV